MIESAEQPQYPPIFTYRETCTILAALRVFLAHELTDPVPNDRTTRICDMDHFEGCTPLTADEIDALCERMEIPPFPDTEPPAEAVGS